MLDRTQTVSVWPLPSKCISKIQNELNKPAQERFFPVQLLLNKMVSWEKRLQGDNCLLMERIVFNPKKNKEERVPTKPEQFKRIQEILMDSKRKKMVECLHARRDGWLNKLIRHGRAKHIMLKAKSDCLVNIVNPGPLELGLGLHHLYGIPCIPGSALKGLALKTCNLKSGDKSIYGSADAAGQVDFLEALVCYPENGKDSIVQLDYMTPHQVKWYREEPRAFPNDRDNPTPLPFLSIKHGAKFQTAIIALHADDPKSALDKAVEDLRDGLRELAIGAKTAAGYGVMELEVIEAPEIELSSAGAIGCGFRHPQESNHGNSASVKKEPVTSSPAEKLIIEIQAFRGGGSDYGALAGFVDKCLALEGEDRQKACRVLADKMGPLREMQKRARNKERIARLLEAAGLPLQ